MCFSFFKKKPKFDWDEVQVTMANAISDLDMNGMPLQANRSTENWELKMCNDEYGVGGYLTLTVDDFKWTVCMYFSKTFNELRRSLAFKNCRLSDKHMAQLRSKYPFLQFRMSANDTLDVDDMPKQGKYVADGIRCKKLEEIAAAVQKQGDDFNYLCVYDNVKKLYDEEKAGK